MECTISDTRLTPKEEPETSHFHAFAQLLGIVKCPKGPLHVDGMVGADFALVICVLECDDVPDTDSLVRDMDPQHLLAAGVQEGDGVFRHAFPSSLVLRVCRRFTAFASWARVGEDAERLQGELGDIDVVGVDAAARTKSNGL